MSTPRKFDYIDVLRGVAILGVLAVHSQEKIAGLPRWLDATFNAGQLGVQLFFLASALTLCLSRQGRPEESNLDFYTRRFFRIAPLYYFGIVLYFCWRLAKKYFLTHELVVHEEYSLLAVAENLLFVHGLDPRHFDFVVPGGWSIATEMGFYLLFPILFAGQSRLSTRACLTLIIAALATILGIEVAILKFLGVRNDGYGFLYCSLLNQLGVFLIGILTYRQLQQAEVTDRALFVAAAALLAGAFLLETHVWVTGLNGFFAPLLAAAGFAVVALRLSRAPALTGAVVAGVKRLGQLSFSVYLLHFMVLDIVVFVLERTTFPRIPSPSAQLGVLFGALTLASMAVAACSHRYIEAPGMAAGARWIEQRRASTG